MPNNPGPLPKMPSAPDVLHSDDPITSGDAEHSVNRPQRQLMPALNLSTATPGGTKKIQQKKGKHLRSVYTSENPEGETDRDVLLPSSSASSAADESEFEDATMETPRRRQKLRARYNHTKRKNQTKFFAKLFSHWLKTPLFPALPPLLQR